jgi:hypothetical protein
VIARLFGAWVFATICSSSAALAYCDPAIDRTPPGEFKRSAFAGIVQVVRTTWLDDARRPAALKPPLMLGIIPGGFDPYSGAQYRARVLRQYKGQPHRFVTIFSENTEARTPLTDGSKYVVFLYRVETGDEDERKGDLMIDTCGNSVVLSKAGALLPALDRLARQP